MGLIVEQITKLGETIPDFGPVQPPCTTKWKDLSDDEIRRIAAAGDFHQGDGCDEEFAEGWKENGGEDSGQSLMDYMIKNDGLDEMTREELLTDIIDESEEDIVSPMWAEYIGMMDLEVE
jgi:hypothetical protein